MANISKLEGINAVVVAISDGLRNTKLSVENLTNDTTQYCFWPLNPVKDKNNPPNFKEPHDRIFSVGIMSDKYDTAITKVSPDLKSDSVVLSFEVCLHGCQVNGNGQLAWDEEHGYTIAAGIYEPNFIFHKDGMELNFDEDGECLAEGDCYIGGDLSEAKDKSLAKDFTKQIMDRTLAAERAAAFKYMLSQVRL